MEKVDNDTILLAEICAGDKSALAELYDKYATSLMRIMYMIVGNRQDAEDLLHDVFLEVWKKSDTYNPARGSVLSWLAIRARCRAIDRKRFLDLQRNRFQNDVSIEKQDSKNQLEIPYLELVVKKAMSQLSYSQRTTLQLCYFQGLTYEEIARVHNIPVGTVKSRIATAIKKLSLFFSVARKTEKEVVS